MSRQRAEMPHHHVPASRRDLLKGAVAAGTAALLPAGAHAAGTVATAGRPSAGPVGFTGFIHPTARLGTDSVHVGAASLISAFVALEGASARLGNASNLQDNDRLLNFSPSGAGRGALEVGDGTFTAHGVTFVGRVRVGDGCGTGPNAVVQNARVGDASFVGLTAQILGPDPLRPIEIPEASLVLFGARIRQQSDVSANVIPVPAPFTLFFADVDEENLVLARGFNLLWRAAARLAPFSDAAGDPRNPGADFPTLEQAFGKLSVAPPTIYRRGTGVIAARQAGLGDLGFGRFQPLSPVPRPSTSSPLAPPPDSPEAGARFVTPRVASPELVADGAIVLGGCELEAGVRVGPGTYVLGDLTPSISIGAGTVIGSNTSLHELTFSSCRVGARCTIGDRVVLHGPLELGDDVHVGDGCVLFGPTVRDGVRIGDRALVFGPLEVTADVPADALVVAPGYEFLIAPSAPRAARVTLRTAPSMEPQWRHAQDAGGACGCGVACLAQLDRRA